MQKDKTSYFNGLSTLGEVSSPVTDGMDDILKSPFTDKMNQPQTAEPLTIEQIDRSRENTVQIIPATDKKPQIHGENKKKPGKPAHRPN
jgi:hypothetical protein